MTDEARIARLTDLARSVWPFYDVSVDADDDGSAAYVNNEPDAPPFIEICHPRALDALEAALLVLADEARIPLTADQVTRDALESCRRDREALTKRIREERAAMEKLAEQWEAEALEPPPEACVHAHPPYLLRITLQECARELRARIGKP